MLSGIDWTSDRDWERAIFGRLSHTDAQVLLDQTYPLFGRDERHKATERARAEAVAAEVERHKERMRQRREKREATA